MYKDIPDIKDRIISLLSNRKDYRKGGELFSIERSQVTNMTSVDLRAFLDSETLDKVKSLLFFYIPQLSNESQITFLDSMRSVREYKNTTDIVGYVYDDGKVIPYVVASISKNENCEQND